MQAEYVNVQVRNKSVIEIEWSFEDNSVAGMHFGFEFKDRITEGNWGNKSSILQPFKKHLYNNVNSYKVFNQN